MTRLPQNELSVGAEFHWRSDKDTVQGSLAAACVDRSPGRRDWSARQGRPALAITATFAMAWGDASGGGRHPSMSGFPPLPGLSGSQLTPTLGLLIRVGAPIQKLLLGVRT